MKAAVIGAGHIARAHLGCLRELPRVQPVAVCDLSRTLAESAADEFGVANWYTDHRLMLEIEKPDVVHVATPPRSHYAIAVDALEAGAHVFIEKPIVTDLDDLQALISLAKTKERVLIEDHNYLFNDSVQKVLGWIESGRFGEVAHIDVVIGLDILGEGSRMVDPNVPHPSLDMPGGVIAEFLTHLAYMSWAFVGPARSLATVWTKREPNSPLPADEFRALISAERGTANLIFSSHTQPDAFFIRVHGSKMRAEAHLFEPKLVCERVRPGAGPATPILNGIALAGNELRSAFASIRRKLSGGPGSYEGQWELLRRSYQCFARGTQPPISIEQIEEVNRLVAEIVDEANRI